MGLCSIHFHEPIAKKGRGLRVSFIAVWQITQQVSSYDTVQLIQWQKPFQRASQKAAGNLEIALVHK
jgi:hypothetical protein